MARTILIVDDEESIIQSLYGIMIDEGFEVISANSGIKAIEKIETIFNSANKFSVRKKLRAGWGSIGKTTGRFFSRRKSADHDR